MRATLIKHSFTRVWALGLCVHVMPFIAHANSTESTLNLSTSVTYAVEYLSNAKTFTSVAVGEGGEASKDGCAMIVLAKSSDPEQAFLKLWSGAKTTVAKIYALIGLQSFNRNEFNKKAKPFRSSSENVPVISGCEVGNSLPVSYIVGIGDPATNPTELTTYTISNGGYAFEYFDNPRCR